jgi:hypothetical protein
LIICFSLTEPDALRGKELATSLPPSAHRRICYPDADADREVTMLSRAEALSALDRRDGRLRGALQHLVHDGDAEARARMVALLAARPPSEIEHLVQLALLATAAPEAIEALVRESYVLRHRNARVRGLTFADGAPGLPFAKNPWEIPRDASFGRALAVLWAPVASQAGAALESLLREVFALVVCELDEGGWAVGYFHPWRRMAHEIEADDLAPPSPDLFTRRESLDWADYGRLGLFFGFAPSAAGSQVSPAMGQFCRVHDGMEDGLLSISRQSQLATLRQIYAAFEKPSGIESFRKNNEGRSPDEFVSFFSYGDDAADVFDLGSRDASGDPLVRRWYGQGMEIVNERATFWQWLEERIPRSFLKIEPEPSE